MLDATQEVFVRRFPFLAVVLTATLALALAACDSGGSSSSNKPRRTTTTSSSTTTTTAAPGASTTTTAPGTSTTSSAQSVGTCGNQTDAIVSAITTSDVGGLNTRQGQYVVRMCRISATSPIWAAADLVPNPGVQLDQATVVLQRIGALWNVDAVGTSGTGCNAPPAVIVDLKLVC
jgi:hypothetical protein